MISHENEVHRRQFLTTLMIAAGLPVLGLSFGDSAVPIPSLRKSAHGRRVRISNVAYQNALKRAKSLVERMTLEEQISQLGAGAHFGAMSNAIPRLKLPSYEYASGEALHGLHLTNPVTSTCFPVPLALAAAWNPELILRIYTAVADEARAYDNRQKIGLSYYSPPTLNLHRDPRWGRCQEVPGEDPCLAATLAVQMVRGMQGDNPDYLKTTACAKHFICNNTEGDRTSTSATVDPRSFWEYYTRAYRATILEGDVFTVMGAYNALNGTPCCANHFLLTGLLRQRWGFRGYVTSDCDAVYNVYNPHHYAANRPIAAAMAVLAGCDLDCGSTLQRNLKTAVALELVSEADIGKAVTRLLTARHLLGLFDPPEKVPYTQIPLDVVDSPAHRALALEAARQSLVLLKNDGQFLPLNKTVLKKIAVIGPLAGTCHLGSYSGIPAVRISPYQGIADFLGITELAFFPASDTVATGGETSVNSSAVGEVYLAFLADGAWVEYPETDFTGKVELQARMSAQADGGRVEAHLDKPDGPLICTLVSSKPVRGQNWFNISAPFEGISGDHSLVLVFHSRGKASLNIERLQLNPFLPPPAQPGRPQVVFQPGCTVTGGKDEKLFNDAVEAARDADVVILVCGVNGDVAGEGRDRGTIGLTGAQPELVQAIYAVNPKTVLVLSTNNSVAINWEQERLPAILCAVCAGQAQGAAIAEVLFGDYNPGGKLPCTWYRSVDQLPPFHDYDIRNGRTYMYFEGDVLYPFGHGLSYSTFHLDQLEMAATTLGPGEKTAISVAITNISKRAGAEVVQLYLTAPPSPVKRPGKQLAGFQHVDLRPGERKRITFELPFTEQAFWYWSEEARRFVLHPGTAQILIGTSSANLLLRGQLTLQATAEVQAEPDTLASVGVKSWVS